MEENIKDIGFGQDKGIWLFGMYFEGVHTTPELAQIILDKCNLKNRDKNDEQRDFLADQMKRGLWIEKTGDTIKIDDNVIMADGQHRLYGVIKSGISQNFVFAHDVDPRAFKVIDTQRSRTAADSFKSEGYHYHTQLAAFTKRYLLLLRNSSDHNVASKRKGISIQDLLSEYEQNREHYDKILQKGLRLYKNCDVLTTTDYSGYISYLIRHKGHSSESVYSFFNQFAEIEPSDFAVMKGVRDRIRNVKLSNKGAIKDNLKKGYITIAWNSFITNTKDLKTYNFKDGEDFL